MLYSILLMKWNKHDALGQVSLNQLKCYSYIDRVKRYVFIKEMISYTCVIINCLWEYFQYWNKGCCRLRKKITNNLSVKTVYKQHNNLLCSLFCLNKDFEDLNIISYSLGPSYSTWIIKSNCNVLLWDIQSIKVIKCTISSKCKQRHTIVFHDKKNSKHKQHIFNFFLTLVRCMILMKSVDGGK